MKLIKNKIYTAIGVCGESHDKEVIGIFKGITNDFDFNLYDHRDMPHTININTAKETDPLIFAKKKYKEDCLVRSASGLLKNYSKLSELHYGNNKSKNIYSGFGENTILIFDAELLNWAEIKK